MAPAYKMWSKYYNNNQQVYNPAAFATANTHLGRTKNVVITENNQFCQKDTQKCKNSSTRWPK